MRRQSPCRNDRFSSGRFQQRRRRVNQFSSSPSPCVHPSSRLPVLLSDDDDENAPPPPSYLVQGRRLKRRRIVPPVIYDIDHTPVDEQHLTPIVAITPRHDSSSSSSPLRSIAGYECSPWRRPVFDGNSSSGDTKFYSAQSNPVVSHNASDQENSDVKADSRAPGEGTPEGFIRRLPRRVRCVVDEGSSSQDDDEDVVQRRRLRRIRSPLYYTPLGRYERFSDLEDDVANKQNVSPQSEESCSICLTDLKEQDVIGRLPKCPHTFCFACIEKWAQVTNICPLCKTRFNSIQRRFPGPQGERDGGEIVVPDKDAGADDDEGFYHDTENTDYSLTDDDDASDVGSDCVCRACGSGHDENVLLLCDGCNSAYHTYCVGLQRVPEGEWKCSRCDGLVNMGHQMMRNIIASLERQHGAQEEHLDSTSDMTSSDDDERRGVLGDSYYADTIDRSSVPFLLLNNNRRSPLRQSIASMTTAQVLAALIHPGRPTRQNTRRRRQPRTRRVNSRTTQTSMEPRQTSRGRAVANAATRSSNSTARLPGSRRGRHTSLEQRTRNRLAQRRGA